MTASLAALMSATTVATGIFFALRMFRLRTLLRFHWLADVVFTILAFVLFQGTLGGVMIASVTGLMFSVFLSLAKGCLRAKDAAAAMGSLYAQR